MSFWPRKISFMDILINSLWSFIAWIIWSVIIVVIVFFAYNIINIDVVWTFQWSNLWTKISPIFPLFLSLITLIWTGITMVMTYFLLTMTAPDKYRKNIVVLWQIAFFWLLTYIFITPVYLITRVIDSQNIMYIFLIHTLILAFWTSIILETLNNYRYILTWIYWSFVWLFISILITLLIFISLPTGFAKLVSLVALLPIINFTTTFFKWIFEFLYFQYNKYTNLDQLWDIFYQIELEEKALLREEEEKNII